MKTEVLKFKEHKNITDNKGKSAKSFFPTSLASSISNK